MKLCVDNVINKLDVTKTLLNMSKSEDDLILKRSSLMMLLNSDVDNPNISVLSKLIGVCRKNVYNIMNRLSLGGK